MIPYALLSIIGGILAFRHPLVHPKTAKDLIYALIGTSVYAFFAFEFLHTLTRALYKLSVHRIGIGKASTARFYLRIAGYAVGFLVLLAVVHIPVARILVYSAVVGIILSVAAQQALANFFASVVIIIDRPFSVGQRIVFVSGALGGRYEGIITDISFSHTKMQLDDGSLVNFPNAPLLSGTAVIDLPKEVVKK